MKLTSVFACLAAVMLTGACYNPDGENYVPVTPPDASQIILDLKDAADTVYIDAQTYVQIVYHGKPTFLAFEVFVDGRSIVNREVRYGDSGFYLIPHTIGTGVYSMEISIQTKSNSGSLMDKLDTERVTFSRKFVLVVEADKPEERVVSYAVKGGVLTLFWQPYTLWNFEAYIVTRNCDPYGSNCKTFRITDPNQTSWEDETYFGGESVWYRVDVVTRSATWPGAESHYYNAPTLSIHNVSDKTIDVHWTKPVFYKHTRVMRLYQGTTLLRETSNLSDTSLTAPNNFLFGAAYASAFTLEGESDAGVKYRVGVPFAVGRQVVAGRVGAGVYNEALESYFLVTNRSQIGYIDRYTQDFTLQASTSSHASSLFTLSLNGKWLWTFPGGNGSAYRLDPGTLTLVESYTSLYSGYLRSGMNISNNNWLAYQNGQIHFLRDMNTRTVKVSSQAGSASEGCVISPEGTYYFYESYALYETRNDKLNFLGTIPTAMGSNFMQFVDNNTLMIVKQGKIRLVSMPALTEEVIDMGTTDTDNVRYDAVSHQLYWTASGECRLMNIVTGEKRRVPLATGSGAPLLANGHLISADGYMIDPDYIKSLNP